jgi:hypothetical protein
MGNDRYQNNVQCSAPNLKMQIQDLREPEFDFNKTNFWPNYFNFTIDL